MRVYTRTGDDGTTGLGSGRRVDKDSLRLEAYGSLDELSSSIGVALAASPVPRLSGDLERIQEELFVLGADLSVPENEKKDSSLRLAGDRIEPLESLMDELSSELEPLKNFILPGGSMAAAQLHVARTVCRRAERLVVTLSREEEIGTPCLRYLNRLSDALFVMARYENHLRGIGDIKWRG